MSDPRDKSGLPEWLMEGYREFLESDFGEQRAHYEHLATVGQSPKVLWIGCSDSRVIPEHILGADSGDIFVLRNVANLVPPINTDSVSSGAVIEFAVGGLMVDDIIVCGHADCGGMKALLQGVDASTMPYLAKWISYSQAAYMEPSCRINPSSAEFENVVKANILQQADHLRTYPCVKLAKTDRDLRIHSLYYCLETGRVQYYDRTAKVWMLLE